MGPRNIARVASESWSTPWDIGAGREPSRRAGRLRGVSEPGGSQSGEMVDPAGPQTRVRVLQDSWSNPQAHDQSASRPGVLVIPGGPWVRSPGLGGRHRGLRDTGPRGPGMLVDTAGPGTWSRVARESWLTPRALGTRPESPGSACRTQGLTEPGSSPPGQLLDTAGPRTRARVAQECTSTVQDHGPRPESPGAAGRPRGPWDMGPIRPAQMVDSAGLQNRA